MFRCGLCGSVARVHLARHSQVVNQPRLQAVENVVARHYCRSSVLVVALPTVLQQCTIGFQAGACVCARFALTHCLVLAAARAWGGVDVRVHLNTRVAGWVSGGRTIARAMYGGASFSGCLSSPGQLCIDEIKFDGLCSGRVGVRARCPAS